jgi:cold shock CspA family protein
MKGTIHKILNDKMYGFIRGEDNQDYFFHKSDMNGSHFDDLSGSERIVVDFEPIQTPRGLRARTVTLVSYPA